jgi:hypothetical protein
MANIKWDDSDFQSKISKLIPTFEQKAMSGLERVANELLRLSQLEVPHDKGSLQNSGQVAPEPGGFIVGYNKVYAAYQHEGVRFDGTYPIKRYQKGRKGKYLEDPMKRNNNVFMNYIKEALT